jgi:hypothetical protein
MLHRQGASWRSDECNPSVQLLIASAERELSSFFLAVHSLFGVEWAHRSALAWIEEMSSLGWPEDDAMPNWRMATLGASIRLASSMSGNPAEG